MAKIGRKSAYETKIKPNLDKIKRMLEEGVQYNKICDAIGINRSTWYRLLNDNKEFCDIVEKSRNSLVSEVRGALKKKAVGFQYLEIKKIKEPDENGKMQVVRIEETLKTVAPDVAAANLLLKNIDRENWSNDPQMLELRKQELELKRKHLESVDW